MNKKIISIILLCTIVIYTVPVMAYTKDETVYSKLNSDGSSYSTIVNSHINNEEENNIINDLSDLLNIKNTNGEQQFTLDGNILSWNAEGSDIYYQGESNKVLPIECNIKYELDGIEVPAEELAGKSGRIKITIEYINKDLHMVQINGKNEKMYTPFTAICGTIINNENNKNIEIKNGKIINDGTKSIVLGISMPGMQESLDISKDKLDIPSIVEITMDSTYFKLNNIMTYITPKVIQKDDIDVLNKVNEIYSQVNTLKSSSKMLVEGGNELKKGTTTYNEKSQGFNGAMKQITNGVSTVNSNYSKLNDGINTLNSGSENLKDGAEKLNQGIKEASNKLSNIPSNIEKLYQGTKTLNSGINGENGLVSGVNILQTNLTETTKTTITELTKNNKILKTEIEKLNVEKTEIDAQIKTLSELKNNLTLDKDKTSIQSIITQLQNRKSEITNRTATLQNIVTENTKVITMLTPTQETNNKLQVLKKGVTEISTGVKTLEESVSKLNVEAEKLPESLKQLTEGSAILEVGTKTLSAGTNTLNSNSKLLKNGINSLNSNTNKLLDANNMLTEGAEIIENGATTLAEGITKFDNEGIQKVYNYINGDVKNITTRLEKLQELADEYNNFTMLEDGNNGNVKFIMIMDSIKKQEDSKEKIINDDKK